MDVFLAGLVIGFILGAFIAIGSADRIIEMYADHNKLYHVGDKIYEIKEIK